MAESFKNLSFRRVFYLLLGNLGYALAFNLFFSENGIAPGGFGGLALVIGTVIPLSTGVIVFLLSVPVFIWSYFVQGLRYTMSALASTALFSIFLDALAFLPTLTDNMMLAAICGAVIYGISSAMILRGRVGSNGTELLARLLVTKIRHISLGTMVALCDGAVVVASMITFGNVEKGLYAVIALAVMSYITDLEIRGSNKACLFQIITDKPTEQFVRKVMEDADRGVTKLNAVGMYKMQERDMLLVVVKPKEIYVMKDLVNQYLPGAFVMVLPANEILGEGFAGIDVTIPMKKLKK